MALKRSVPQESPYAPFPITLHFTASPPAAADAYDVGELRLRVQLFGPSARAAPAATGSSSSSLHAAAAAAEAASSASSAGGGAAVGVGEEQPALGSLLHGHAAPGAAISGAVSSVAADAAISLEVLSNELPVSLRAKMAGNLLGAWRARQQVCARPSVPVSHRVCETRLFVAYACCVNPSLSMHALVLGVSNHGDKSLQGGASSPPSFISVCVHACACVRACVWVPVGRHQQSRGRRRRH